MDIIADRPNPVARGRPSQSFPEPASCSHAPKDLQVLECNLALCPTLSMMDSSENPDPCLIPAVSKPYMSNVLARLFWARKGMGIGMLG